MGRRLAVVVAVALLGLAVAGPAWAKGPEGATISGPDIAEPIVIDGFEDTSADFSRFVDGSGFWPLVFGADGYPGELGEVVGPPSSSDLGPAYVVMWHLLENRIEARIYPQAEDGPLVHVEPGLRLDGFETETVGGWFAARPMLLDLMARYGVPVAAISDPAVSVTEREPALTVPEPVTGAQATSPSASPTLPAMVALALMVAGAGVWWATRRRPRRVSVP